MNQKLHWCLGASQPISTILPKMTELGSSLVLSSNSKRWLNHGNPSRGTKTSHFLREALFRALANSMHKRFTAELMDVSGLWDLNEKKVEELLYLLVFGVLEAKYDQVRKIDKKRQQLHALERATGCTSWICNNWTAGVTAVDTRCWILVQKLHRVCILYTAYYEWHTYVIL